MMSSREWEEELKCSATGNPRDRFRLLRRCSLKRSHSRLRVSLMYRQLQRRQEMQCTTFSDWQVKWSWMLCALFGPCRKVCEVMCLQVWHRGRRQGNERPNSIELQPNVVLCRLPIELRKKEHMRNVKSYERGLVFKSLYWLKKFSSERPFC